MENDKDAFGVSATQEALAYIQDKYLELNIISDAIHQLNHKWWVDINDPSKPIERNVGELLMLAVSELSEALEGHRKNLIDDKLPHRMMFEVEIVDCIIRLLDLSAGMKLDIGRALYEKCVYNANREDHKIENRRAENGKKY